jgi:hypothetical protein
MQRDEREWWHCPECQAESRLAPVVVVTMRAQDGSGPRCTRCAMVTGRIVAMVEGRASARHRHTPPPWTTQATGDGYPGLRVVGPGGGELCRASQANARLIAAAPTLLAACEEALALISEFEAEALDGRDEVPYLLRAAIARAKGGPQ